jgi:hypothetical protein
MFFVHGCSSIEDLALDPDTTSNRKKEQRLKKPFSPDFIALCSKSATGS